MGFIIGADVWTITTADLAAAVITMILKGVLLLGLVAIFMACWKGGSGARRHLVWVVGMAGLFAVPVLSYALPGWNVVPGWLDSGLVSDSAKAIAISRGDVGGVQEHQAPAHKAGAEIPQPAAGAIDVTEAQGDAENSNTRRNEPAQNAATQRADHAIVTSPEDRVVPRRARATAWFMGIWSAGVAALLLRLAASQFGLWLLARRCEKLTDERILAAVEQLRLGLSIGRWIRLHSGREGQIPMTWGLLAPHLLLPRGAEQWSAVCLRSVLAHELAHVRRWDCHTQLLAQVTCAVHWLNPFAWWAARQIGIERERACDDAALSTEIPAVEYAKHLMEIASGLSRRQLAALAMARPSRMAGRLAKILSVTADRRSVNGATRLMTVLVLMTLVMPIASMRATSSAAEEKTDRSAGENPDRTPAADNSSDPIVNENKKTNDDETTLRWSEPLGNFDKQVQGLQFRFSAPRTVFQAWELPTFVMEVRNGTAEVLTSEMISKVFQSDANPDGLRFLFKDAHRRALNPNLWLVPEVRMDLAKLIGLNPGEVIRETVTLTQMRERSAPLWDPYALIAGRYTVGLGVLAVDREVGLKVELKTNEVTLNMLPPGVETREELDRFLRRYEPGGRAVKAGFVPNETTLVWGEPIFATFLVENLGDEPFTFGFGGDYRGSGRHDRFTVDVIDADGKLTEDPAKNGFEGGILMWRTAQAHDAVVETVELAKYRTIPGPGTYRVTCRFVLTPSWTECEKADFNVPVETTYELTILPRDVPNVERVLTKMFDQCDRTGGLPLTKLVDTGSSFGQGMAVTGLAKMGTDGDVEHRVAAAIGLGKIATPEAMNALLQMNRDRAVDVRAAVITALGAFTEAPAVEAVVTALSDLNELLRETAAGALGQMKTEAAIDALIGRLPESNPAVSAAILRGMGTSQSARVFEIIVRSLGNKNATIRRAALDAAVQFPVEEAASGALRPFAASDDDMDFREAVIQRLAESLKQPIEMEWLIPVIKSRKGTHTIGDAPRLMRLYGGNQAVPAMLSCLDFDDPTVRSYYNMTVIDNQLACRGALAIPWHADLNRDGTAAETEENRRTLKILKGWVEYYRTHQVQDDPWPGDLSREEEEKTWGEGADDLSIRARVGRSVWPWGLPQVVSIDARSLPGEGSVHFSSRPEVLEIEVNSEWYSLPEEAVLSVSGDWNAYRGNALQELQLDGRWRRKTDGQALELKPGSYTVRVGVSLTPKERRTGLAMSRPVKFEVIASE